MSRPGEVRRCVRPRLKLRRKPRLMPSVMLRVLVMTLGLMLVLGAPASAQEAVPSPADAMAPPAASARAYHWLGSGAYQCEGVPAGMAINPAGTRLLASGWFQNSPIRVFSIPDGHQVPVPDDPEAPTGNAYPDGAVHWLDDHRAVVHGMRVVSDLGVDALGIPNFIETSFCQTLFVLDIQSGLRRAFTVPAQANASHWILTHDGTRALFPCPMPPALIFRADEDEQGPGVQADGIASLDLATGVLRRGFSVLPAHHRFYCQQYALSSDDRYLAMLGREMSRRSRSAGSLIQIWDVAQGTLLRTIPFQCSSAFCDLRFGADDDQLELLGLDPPAYTVPMMAQVTLSSGAVTQTPGWTIVRSDGLSPRVVARIGPTTITLPDHRSLSYRPARGPAPLPWISNAALSVNGTIACDRAGRYYAIAYGTCITVADLRHAWMGEHPAQESVSCPLACCFLEDDTLAVAYAGMLVFEDHGGHATVMAPPPLLDWSSATSFCQSALVASTSPAWGPVHTLVWDLHRGTVLRAVSHLAYPTAVSLSPHQQFAAYQQDSGQVVLADLTHPERAESVIGPAEPLANYVEIFWSTDDRLVCMTRMFRERAGGVYGYRQASAWDCRSAERRWLPRRATGDVLEDLTTLVPNADGSLVVAVQSTPVAAPAQTVPALLLGPYWMAMPEFPTWLLDGHSGRVLHALDDVGHLLGFTPDGSRIVGNRCVLRVADNQRLLEVPDANRQNQCVASSPSNTWIAVGQGMQWESIHDTAGAGIKLPVPLSAIPQSAGFRTRCWNAGEDRLAITAAADSRVCVVDLYPAPGPASDPDRALAELDHAGEWLVAACSLASCGERAVAILSHAPLTARRIIALERCAAGGSTTALTMLSHARALPGALGLLAGDAYARRERALHSAQLAAAEEAAGGR